MKSPTQPLVEELRSLHGRVEMLRSIANTVGTVPVDSLRREVEEASRFLREDVIPLCTAERGPEFDAVGKVLGSAAATAPLRLECEEVVAMARELESVRRRLTSVGAAEREADNLRRVLYGLYTLLRVHLANEEETVLPLLDTKLTPDQAHQLVDAMARMEDHARTGAK